MVTAARTEPLTAWSPGSLALIHTVASDQGRLCADLSPEVPSVIRPARAVRGTPPVAKGQAYGGETTLTIRDPASRFPPFVSSRGVRSQRDGSPCRSGTSVVDSDRKGSWPIPRPRGPKLTR